MIHLKQAALKAILILAFLHTHIRTCTYSYHASRNQSVLSSAKESSSPWGVCMCMCQWDSISEPMCVCVCVLDGMSHNVSGFAVASCNFSKWNLMRQFICSGFAETKLKSSTMRLDSSWRPQSFSLLLISVGDKEEDCLFRTMWILNGYCQRHDSEYLIHCIMIRWNGSLPSMSLKQWYELWFKTKLK